jgi:hypothetical protein
MPQLRHLRLELDYNDRPGLSQPSLCYGIWSTFLILPALREVKLLIRFSEYGRVGFMRDWLTISSDGIVIRNIVAAIPSSVKLSAAEALPAIDPANVNWACSFITQKELNRPLRRIDTQGSDAEMWKSRLREV